MTLTPQGTDRTDQRGFSRLNFGKIATMLAAGTTLPFYNESAMAQLSKIDNIPDDAVNYQRETRTRSAPAPKRWKRRTRLLRMADAISTAKTDKAKNLLASRRV